MSPNAATVLVLACLKICDRGEHITAEELWESVALQAFALCGAKAASELDRCGIHNAENIGRIVVELGKAGRELPPVDVEPSRYTGLWSAGEIIEPCLQLRQDPSPDIPALAVDVQCMCQYNLRGLKPDGQCPECGVPITMGVLSSSRRAGQIRIEALDEIQSKVERVAAFRAGVAPMAVEMVLAGLAQAIELTRGTVAIRSSGAIASDVCAGILDVAIGYHGAHAVRMLERLGMTTARDVGRIIEHLEHLGLLMSEEMDGTADFRAGSRFADLFEAVGRGRVRGTALLVAAKEWCPREERA